MDEYHTKQMKIYLINQQNNHNINHNNILKLVEELGTNIKSSKKNWDEITIIITDHTGIKKLNNKYFKKDYTTDVISFLYHSIPGEKNALSGDIIVNLDQVFDEGNIRDNINYELAFYIAHGLDHLNGNDDNTSIKRNKMHDREKKWIEKAIKQNLLNNLIA